jgi:hypothetical protein
VQQRDRAPIACNTPENRWSTAVRDSGDGHAAWAHGTGMVVLMASKNSERLEAHKRNFRADGFKRLSVWVCPELAAMLAAERRPGECGGRVRERLLLGAAKPRPKYER